MSSTTELNPNNRHQTVSNNVFRAMHCTIRFTAFHRQLIFSQNIDRLHSNRKILAELFQHLTARVTCFNSETQPTIECPKASTYSATTYLFRGDYIFTVRAPWDRCPNYGFELQHTTLHVPAYVPTAFRGDYHRTVSHSP